MAAPRVSDLASKKPRLRRIGLSSFWALIPMIAITSWVTIDPPYRNSPPIRSDGLGYYAWTEAIIQRNFNFCQWPSLAVVHADLVRNPRHVGRCMMNYPPGLALLRFPVMAPVAAIADPSQYKDLVVSGAEEKTSLWLGALALVLECWLVLLAMRRLGVSPPVANAVTLAGCFGTGLFDYGTFDSSFTHVYSAALFSGLLLLGVAAAARRRLPNPLILFVLSFFIGLIREPNVPVLLFALAAWLVWQLRPLRAPDRGRALVRTAGPVLLAVGAVAGYQVLYNRWASGAWTLNSYGIPFTPDTFNQGHVLFAYNHGLFVWYPVLALMLGIALWRRPARGWGVVAGGMVAILAVIYGAWPSWWLGGGLGQRGFVDIVPFITVAGGLGISSLPRKWLTRAAVVAVAVTSLATVELTAAYWDGTIPPSRNDASQYWQVIVGKYSLLNGRLG